MKSIPRTLYGLLMLAIGTSAAVVIVYLATGGAHDAKESEERLNLELKPQEIIEGWMHAPRHRESHFHQLVNHELPGEEYQSACLTCHSNFPHTENPRYRSFLNQHSRFMTCLVCHLAPEHREDHGLAWDSFGTSAAADFGGPYGLDYEIDGGLTGTKDMHTRIVPVTPSGDALFTPYNDPEFRDFRNARVEGSGKDALSFRRQAERMMGKPYLNCRDCHTQNSEIPFQELGFSEERRLELIHSAQVEMVEADGIFYFPSLR